MATYNDPSIQYSQSGIQYNQVGGATTVSRTATTSGTGSQVAISNVRRLRTAAANGTGSQVANGLVRRIRTASATGTSSETCLIRHTHRRAANATGNSFAGTVSGARRFRTAATGGTGSSICTVQKTTKRSATANGIGTATVLWVATPRPLNPPRTSRQALRRSSYTSVTAEAPVLLVPKVIDIQPIEPRLVFDHAEDDEIMLCLA